MVQYLHFRILKLPLIWPIVDLPSYKIVNFHRFLYVYQRLCCITQMFYGEKNHWLIDSNNINHNYNVGPLVISWFISPSNYIVISTINHSYWSYKPTYIAILGAPHCINHPVIGPIGVTIVYGEKNKRIGLILDLPHDLAGLDLDASGSDPLDPLDPLTIYREVGKH